MAKNINDEYYTPRDLAEYCVNKTKEVLSLSEGTTFLEPSAGGGAFLPYLPDSTVALDINPQHKGVVLGNFLEDSFEYKKGLCVIGNPPFGFRNALAVKFFKKAITVGDSISFILPISQLNNQQQMFEFDLIYSEDLGKRNYSGVDVHCCLNIFKLPKTGRNKKKPVFVVQGVSYSEYRRGGCNNVPYDYDIGFCRFGSIGKQPTHIGQYAQEGYLKIDKTFSGDKNGLITYLKTFDWKAYRPSTSTPTLYKWEIMKVVSDYLGLYHE